MLYDDDATECKSVVVIDGAEAVKRVASLMLSMKYGVDGGSDDMMSIIRRLALAVKLKQQ